MLVIITEYHLKIYWERHNLIIGTMLMCLVHIFNICFDVLRYLTCASVDDDDLSDCQVTDNTTRLTCSFSLARFPTANIVWNMNNNNIINETSNISVCACRVTSTVIVSLQNVSASTSCAALFSNKIMTQYPFKRCGLF